MFGGNRVYDAHGWYARYAYEDDQWQRLQRQSWAVVGMTPTTGSDGKTYEMTFTDRRTFTMWLAGPVPLG